MNMRCYRCGRSFSIGREAVEAAAVASAGQKFHVVYCPNCRTAIKIPMVQVMRELPAGWQPPAPAAEAAGAVVAEPATLPTSEGEPEAVAEHKSPRRHRHAKSSEPAQEAASAVAAPTAAPVEPVVEPVVEERAAEIEAPAPKRTRKPKAKAEETAPDAEDGASAEAAPAAKKTARKRAKPKTE